ncbi:MAG: hypothetical protein PHO32_06705 [Candidatus Cloacimonetes bacterium]|nr:hypothetical protein [Candidatus Cloacimonadota bacterium]
MDNAWGIFVALGAMALLGGIFKFISQLLSGKHHMLDEECSINFYDKDGNLVPISKYRGKIVIIQDWLFAVEYLVSVLKFLSNEKQNPFINNAKVQYIILYHDSVIKDVTYDLKMVMELADKAGIEIPYPVLHDKERIWAKEFPHFFEHAGCLVIDQYGKVKSVPSGMKSNYIQVVNSLLTEDSVVVSPE